jgi:solute carrier family 35 protein E1
MCALCVPVLLPTFLHNPSTVASGLFMVVLWATGMQPKPRVDKGFLLALMPVALFHTVGHVSACVSFSQVCGGQRYLCEIIL